MEPKELFYEKENSIAKIILNRPEKRNALSVTMTHELIGVLQDADRDPAVKVIVLTGTGKVFCAGGDLDEFSRLREKSAPAVYNEGVESTALFRMGVLLRKPLVTAVNGPAVGGGCGLVAMSHLAVASEEAKFGTPEIKAGMFPFVIFPLLVRAVGPRKALALALTGEMIAAPEAERIGLVNKVVPAETLLPETMKLAEKLAGYSPLVLRLGLDVYNTAVDLEINQAFSYLNALRVVDFLSADLQEGVRAFLEKRLPRWQGK